MSPAVVSVDAHDKALQGRKILTQMGDRKFQAEMAAGGRSRAGLEGCNVPDLEI